jgi:probable addiction module antidote protein
MLQDREMNQTKRVNKDKSDNKATLASLNTALAKGNLSQFLKLLNKMTTHYGMTELSRLSGLDRSNLYEIFSARGTPRLSTLYLLLDSLGFQLAVRKKGQK